MTYDWRNKVVLITGASSGIGRAVALELGRRGASVALLARRAEGAERAAQVFLFDEQVVAREGGERADRDALGGEYLRHAREVADDVPG